MKKYSIVVSVVALLLFLSGCGKNQWRRKSSGANGAEGNECQYESESGGFAVGRSSIAAGEDIVGLFFNLINEKKIPDAVAMLDDSAVPDDSAKQAWGVQFNVFNSISVKSIEPSNIGEKTEGQETFKVVLDAKIKPGSENAVIPNYGWDKGENIRWVSLKKNSDGMWKILGIGTGP